MKIHLDELGMAREYTRGHAFEDLSSEQTRLINALVIAVSILMIPVAIWQPQCWWWALGLFVVGRIFQFIGHAFEGKPPEFFKDWRFLFVGLNWWFAKLAGKA